MQLLQLIPYHLHSVSVLPLINFMFILHLVPDILELRPSRFAFECRITQMLILTDNVQ